MGSNRKLLFGVLLVVAGLIFWGLMRAINNAGSKPVPTPVPVAVQSNAQVSGRRIAYAAGDIPQGSIVTKEMLELRPQRAGGLTTGFISDPEAQAIGFITRVPISKGALIRPADDFVGHISETGIAGALRPGTRAIVIPFANKPTLHDLVRIGNFIDINAAFDGQEARTIVQNVRVLAVDVFGNDFPQVNIAARGPYRAEPKGKGIASSPDAPSAPGGAPGATPTPTAAPAQAPPRPDPAVTLEVTPAQANTILLAQASSAVLDFVVRPALPGGRSAEGTLVDGAESDPNVPGANPNTTVGATVRSISVTKAQIAPYAERKKAAGGASNATRTTSSRETSAGPVRQRERINFGSPPVLPQVGPGGGNLGSAPTPPFTPPLPVESPTYDIPIYADGKTVRVETVRRPQE
ncbi:MAG TPA: Flp pilus assembly protein CpaB [Abditibacterium sp.]|jgi:Flp pilus assembly protein CpaB